jgi:NADH:ubiquinone oxidoreductase subunit F (NADH-binding)
VFGRAAIFGSSTSSSATSTAARRVHLRRGDGLLEALEGKRGWPRNKPPFPAIAGAFAKPTVINNVETLQCVPLILEKGPDWFKSMGTKSSPGPSSTA